MLYIKVTFSHILGLDFTKDGHYMALAERRNCKDFLSIFACKAWKMVKVCVMQKFGILYFVFSFLWFVMCFLFSSISRYKLRI